MSAHIRRLPLRWRRSTLLFALALTLPCVLLAGLAGRLMLQDRELAEKRAADQRAELAARVGAELRSRLDSIRRSELQRRGSPRYASDATLLVATLDSTGLQLPWEMDERALAFRRAIQEPDFADRLRRAERLEFAGAAADSVFAAYHRVRAAATDLPRRSFVDLLLARARAKRDVDEARRTWLALSQLGSEVRDEQGVPLALYAMQRIAASDGRLDAVRQALRVLTAQMEKTRWLSPVACHAAAQLQSSGPERATDERRFDCRQLEAAAAWARSQPLELREEARPSARWSADSARQFVTAADRNVLIVLDLPKVAALGRDILPPGATVGAGDRGGTVPLGAAIRGLHLALPQAGESTAGLRTFYLASLALVLMIGLVGAYGIWRDTQRDIALAELRSQFVASVTHELKTPLTAIRMFADTLRARQDAPHAFREEYLSTIAAETERLTRLLNNVLDFSAVERGEREYRFASHDLRDSAEAALRTMRYAMEQRGFTLEVDEPGMALPVRGDADALEQALLNLLTNAVKYSAHGRVVSVALGVHGADAFVSIRDRGIGIAPEHRARVFEKFYRVRDPETDAIGGAGLGLTLVQHIVAAHGGRVMVDSVPREGSTFTMLIPLAREVHASMELPAPRARVSEESR